MSIPKTTVVLWFCSSSPEMLQQWSSVPQQPQQKSLSVVTTVWGGMTPTSQTSPYSNTRLPGAYTNKAMYNSSVQPGFNAASPPMQKGPPYNTATMSYNRQTPGPGSVYNQQKSVLYSFENSVLWGFFIFCLNITFVIFCILQNSRTLWCLHCLRMVQMKQKYLANPAIPYFYIERLKVT